MPSIRSIMEQARRWALGLAGLVLVVAGQQATASDLTDWQASPCVGCHGSAGNYAVAPSISSTYGKILPAASITWLNDDTSFRNKLKASISPMGDSNGPAPNSGYGYTLSNAEITAFRNYLLTARNAVVSTPSFSNTSVGSNSTANITITNMRGAEITYSAPSITSGSSDFSITAESCATRIVPEDGGTCTITVRFAPTTFGTRNGSLGLSFVNNGQDPTPPSRSVSLSGTGLGPSFSIGSATLTFSTMEGTNTTQSTTISNNGNASMTLGTLSFSGTASGDYSLGAGNTCVASGVIAAAGSCTLVVRFAPAGGTVGTRNASLSVTHNAPGSPQAVTLSGTSTAAPAAHITLTQSTLTFGSVQLGSSLAASAVTVTNTGDADLSWSALTLGGSVPGDYSRSGTCALGTPVTANGGTCTVIMTFSPTALGSRTASLTLASNADNGSQLITLSGTGIPVPAPLVSLNPTTLSFGTQTVGGLYPAKTVTLTNSGTATLNISSLSITGASFSLVTASPCGSSLAAGASCNIDIRFNPASVAASITGSLNLSSNAAGSPHSVPLDGSGSATAAPILAWQTTSPFNFGTVAAGSVSAEQQATLKNMGPGGATLNLVNIVGANSSSFTVDLSGCSVGAAFYEGQTCLVKVRFAPASLGTKQAAVQVVSTGTSPGAFDLQGTGSGGAAANISLSATSLNFGYLKVGEGSAPIELRMSNSGSDALHIDKVTLSGPYAIQYKTCPLPPFDMSPGFECAVTLTFLPSSPGAGGGTLRIESNAADTPNAVITLNGQAEGTPQTSSGTIGGGGGCSIASGDSPFDPTLWLIVVVAAGVLLYRNRQARRVLAERELP
ncbi:MAG: choice-of-anchor D domain-containing protein [Rhodocyclaceae bacterium]